MNQPTREEFNELKEEVRKLREQQTEPIKVTRLEIDSGSMKDDVGVLKIQIQGARADILQIRESQGDLRDRLIEHSEDLKVIKDKQDAHSELLGQLINIGEETRSDIAEIKATQSDHGELLKLILAELRKSRGE